MQMKTGGNKVFLAVTILMLTQAVSAQISKNAIDLKIGAQAKLPVKNVKSIEMSNDKIVSAKLSGEKDVYLSGLSKGLSTVTVMDSLDRASTFVVTTWKVLPSEVKTMLEDIPGVKLVRSGDKTVLSGGLLTEKDKTRIAQLASVFKTDITDLTFYDDQQFKKEAIKKILKGIKNPTVNANFVGDNVVLSGTAYDEAAKADAGIVATSYVGEKGKTSNAIQVINLPVEIDVVMVELLPDYEQRIGAQTGLGSINVPSAGGTIAGGGAAAAGAIASSYQINPESGRNVLGSTTISASLATLGYEYLIRKSLFKSIRRPHIATISGKPGTIHYGGQVGMRVAGTNDGSVEYKDFGLKLEVTPVVRPDNTIVLTVDFEQSAVRPAAIGGSDITFDEFKTTSSAEVKVGQTIVISGLKQVTRDHAKSFVPFIGQIPVLDKIFGSDNRDVEKTDIVLLLTPELPTIEKKFTGPKGSSNAKSLYQRCKSSNMDLKGITPEDRP